MSVLVVSLFPLSHCSSLYCKSFCALSNNCYPSIYKNPTTFKDKRDSWGPPFHSLVKQSSPLLSQKASVLHFLTPSCLSVGAPFLLISVVSTDGAASSQLDTAQPSYTSNQSKEQSIVCVVWGLSEQQTPACCTTLQWLTYTEPAPFAWLWEWEKERDCLKCREMLIFNYAFSWSRECIMRAGLMKGKYSDKSKRIYYSPTEEQIWIQELIHIEIASSSFLWNSDALILGGILH